MVLPIFNPLKQTWAISGPPRGQKRHFGPKQPFCQGKDYFAYFELAENPSKSGKCFELKSNSPFLGDVGLIQVVSELSFGHPKCHFWARKGGHFWQKWPFSGTKNGTFWCQNKNSETTFISPISPKNDENDSSFRCWPLLDGFQPINNM